MTVDTGPEAGPGATWRPPAGIGAGVALGVGEQGIEPPADFVRPALSLPVWWDDDAGVSAPAMSFEKPAAPPPVPSAAPAAALVEAPSVLPPVAPTDADLGPPVPSVVRPAAVPAPADPLPGSFEERHGTGGIGGMGGVDGADGDPDFGWSFEPDPEFGWEEPTKPSPPWWRHPIALLSAAVVFVGVAGTYVMLGSEEEEPPPPPPSAAPQPATPISPEELAAHQARSVAVKTAEGRLQVTWKVPDLPEDVVGYAVVAQTPTGELLDRKLVDPDELVAVFTDRAALPGTCAVVTTLVRAAPSLMLAKGNAVCLPTASGSPGAGAGTSSPGSTGTPAAASPAPDTGADAPDEPAPVAPDEE
ncbi:hypothetical protein [Streptodolium elevatio]